MTREHSDWLSIRAVLWVLDEAPDVPAPLVSTLIGIARHADESGRNSYPSQTLLARYTRKTVRQVRKDLAALVEKGLIRVADDQGAAAHIRGDRRPVVYDLPCGIDRPNGRNSTTGRVVPAGTVRPVLQGHTGGTPGANDRNPSSDEETKKTPEQPPLRGPAHEIVAKACPDADEEEVDVLAKQISSEAKTSVVGYANTLASRGELTARLERQRTARPGAQRDVAGEIEHARRDPRMRCAHGTDGGLYLRPDTGRSATCPFCRRGSPRAEAVASA